MSRAHLLLVDNDSQNLQLMEVSLRKAGFQVTTSGDGRDALGKASLLEPDLVLSEVDLPGLDGFGLLDALRAQPRTASLPMVFLTEDPRVEKRVRALEAGVADYLSKPIYIKEIVARVRIHLQKAERRLLLETPASEFDGSLADMGLVDLLRTLEERTGVVTCAGPRGESAALWIRDGRVEDAQLGRLSGAAAFHRLLTWSDGRWHLHLGEYERQPTITLTAAELLSEGLGRLDAWERELERLPGLDAVYEVDFVALASRLGEIPDEVNAVLRLLDGRRELRQVVEDSPFDDASTLAVVNRLVEENIVRPVHAQAPSSPVLRALESWGASPSPLARATRDVGERVESEPVRRAPLPVDEAGRPLRGAALARALGARSLASDTTPTIEESVEETPLEAVPEAPPASELTDPALDAALEAAAWEAEIADGDEANAWAGTPEEDEAPAAGGSFDLESLLGGEGASARQEETRELIPVMRYPPRQGVRRERLEQEAQLAREAAAAQGEQVVALDQEIVKPGARTDEALEQQVEQRQEAPAEDLSTTAEDLSTTAEALSTTADDLSTTAEDLSTTAEDLSTTAEDLSTTAEDLSTTAEDLSATPEDLSTTAEDLSTTPEEPRVADNDEDDDDEFADVLRRNHRGPLIAVALLAIVGGAVAAVFALQGSEPAQVAEAPVAVVEPAPEPMPEPEPTPATDTTAVEAVVDAGAPEVTEVVEAPPAEEPVIEEAVAEPEPAVAKAPEVKPEPRPVVARPAPRKPSKADLDKMVNSALADAKSEKWTRVASTMRRVLDVDPKHPIALRELGKAQYVAGQFNPSRTNLLAATRLAPSDADAFMWLGLVCQELDRNDEAKRAYQRFLELEPKTTSRYKEILSVLENMGR